MREAITQTAEVRIIADEDEGITQTTAVKRQLSKAKKQGKVTLVMRMREAITPTAAVKQLFQQKQVRIKEVITQTASRGTFLKTSTADTLNSL